MKNLEYEKMLEMNYEQLVQHLKEKYGQVKGDYFLNPECKNRNTKITRTKDGLYIHHIDEDKAILLSTTDFCSKNDFNYQKSDRLVYCDYLEHLLLHIKIVENPSKFKNIDENVGIGGIINFFIPELNAIYGEYEFKKSWMLNIVNKVKKNENDYLKILEYALKNNIISPDNILRISVNQDLITNNKIFHKLIELKNKFK